MIYMLRHCLLRGNINRKFLLFSPGDRLSWKPGSRLLSSHRVWPRRTRGLLPHWTARKNMVYFRPNPFRWLWYLAAALLGVANCGWCCCGGWAAALEGWNLVVWCFLFILWARGICTCCGEGCTVTGEAVVVPPAPGGPTRNIWEVFCQFWTDS